MNIMARELIAYFSRAGENYFSGSYRHIDVGNTEVVAGMIRDVTGADMFRIEMAEPYSDVYDECIAQAKEDQRKGARPELRTYLDGIDGYDTVYLGFPDYWGTMPMRSSRSWRGTTSPARPSGRSAPTRAADSAARSPT